MVTLPRLKIHLPLFAICIAFLMACNSGNESIPTTGGKTISPMPFNMPNLIGSWAREEDGKTSQEIWEVNGDKGWKSSSKTVDEQGVLIFNESVLLEKRNEVWNYCVTTPGQNNNEEVCFALVSCNEKQMRFENKAHDFPQAITYEWVDNNNLLAYIEGPDGNGGTMRIDFEFKRE